MIGGRETIGQYGPTEDHQLGETARGQIQKIGIITILGIEGTKAMTKIITIEGTVMTKEVMDHTINERIIITANTEGTRWIMEGMEEEMIVGAKDRILREITETQPARETRTRGGR